MSKPIRTLLLLAGILGLALVSSGPASALLAAQPDSARHPYVGVIFNDAEFCTASAIGPRLLITASHCLEGGSDFYANFAEQPAKTSGWPDPSAPGVVHGTG